MARLIHLNGAPGIGKSTIAERYAAAHPGVLNCDIDRLRMLIGGWRDDFEATGEVIRPVALAMIREHLAGGRDVVLPQMLVRERELQRFEAVARETGHDYVHLMLRADIGTSRHRFEARPPDDPLHALIGEVVAAQGGPSVVDGLEARLVAIPAVYVDARGTVGETLASVVAALG
ncbi:hypothetical protein ASG90_05110 [Nocardioides sp. Soil797]|nr:hypothetical protein ASG90_05110 [Nocardioides sp. Soil797]